MADAALNTRQPGQRPPRASAAGAQPFSYPAHERRI